MGRPKLYAAIGEDEDEGEAAVFAFDQLAPLNPPRLSLDERRRLAEIELERLATKREQVHGTPEAVREKRKVRQDRELTNAQCAEFDMLPKSQKKRRKESRSLKDEQVTQD